MHVGQRTQAYVYQCIINPSRPDRIPRAGRECRAEKTANLRAEGRGSDGEQGDDVSVRELGSTSFTRPHSGWVLGPTASRVHPITTVGPSHPANLVRIRNPKHTW